MTARRIVGYSGTAALMLILFGGLLLSASFARTPDALYQPGPDPIANDLSAADSAPGNKGNDVRDILDMDPQELSNTPVVVPSLNMEVSTVSRTTSSVGKSPAAVFVITNEMIQRSGARNIPEALRLAPGVNVERIDGTRWAISIRGFNNYYSRKLLVQIDGRTIYVPTFGGVYWDTQHVVLEDVERIEVIRGPGGTIWGANAVNGVINILTKSAKDTQGVYYQASAGSHHLGESTVRYGGQLGANAHYRVYGMWQENGADRAVVGPADNGQRLAQSGFRLDWKTSCTDTMTFQGDCYVGNSRYENLIAGATPADTYKSRPFTSRVAQNDENADGNLLYRWTRKIDDKTDWAFQSFYSQTTRDDLLSGFEMYIDIYDFDYQYRFPWGDRHDVICGCAYRNTRMKVGGDPFNVLYNPSQRQDNLFSYFIQDQITLREDRLYFVAGSKFEHNDYTSFEYQPSVRLLWTPSERHCIWGSISRAIQMPTFGDVAMDLTGPTAGMLGPVPVFSRALGNPGIRSENVLAYEAGIRVQPTKAFYWDLALFFNKYDNVLTFGNMALDPGLTSGGWPALYLTGELDNHGDAETYGLELSAGYTLNEQWRLRGTYSFLSMHMRIPADEVHRYNVGEDPRNQFTLWLSGDLSEHWHVDFVGRYVDSLYVRPSGVLPGFGAAPSYFVGDVRLAWRPRKDFELFVVGRNLLNSSHLEYSRETVVPASPQYMVQSEVLGGINLRY
ncbi:MAG: TonB-dependent receptor [Pirellulales bacterium]|nr:TonB-dependent receptor [Pirellulales bacterium]